MNLPSIHWSSDVRQLLFIGTSVLTAIALSYDYMAREGLLDAFLAFIGTSLLLALIVIVSVLLSDRS
ncbi:MAG: hypothetical protein A07HN63_02196, partial [uncultured archaeon A07HN63]